MTKTIYKKIERFGNELRSSFIELEGHPRDHVDMLDTTYADYQFIKIVEE